MKNKKLIFLVLFLLILGYFFVFYPTKIRCYKGGKEVERTFFKATIYSEKGKKEAICNRKKILYPIYECVFDFQDKKFDNVLIDNNNVYVLFDVSEEKNCDIQFSFCGGNLVMIEDKTYCILYACNK